MALTLSVPAARSLCSAIASAWFRSRRFWHRATKPGPCPLCGDKLANRTDQLLQQGFYGAAIASARLNLELIVAKLYKRCVPPAERSIPKTRNTLPFHIMVREIERAQGIDRKAAKQLMRIYSKSSRIVHGDVCSRSDARTLRHEVRLTAELLLAKGVSL